MTENLCYAPLPQRFITVGNEDGGRSVPECQETLGDAAGVQASAGKQGPASNASESHGVTE